MINLENITSKNNEEHNEHNHPHRILIIGGSRSGKTNTLLNLIKEQDVIDKIYLYAKNLNKSKYEFLIKKHENVGIKHCNNPNTFVKYSNTIDDVFKNIDDYNPNSKRKILIVFNDMIADIMRNKRLQAIIKELFIKCRKLNISLVFITQFYNLYHTIFITQSFCRY